ncbi:MAG: HAD-IA family hydrolase [Clostridiales bacterium]|nr:HAD-IA family hydrolase [Clostridiales bacterium]
MNENAVPASNSYDIMLCDADDTVLDFKKAMRTSIISAARLVGVRADDEKIVKEFGEASHIVWRKLEDKLIERDELDTLRFSMLKERLGEQFNVRDMSEAFLENLKQTRFLIDGATEFLSAVRARGIKVYILTNGLAEVAHERLKALDGYIDGAFISEEMGYNKPDSRLFDCVFKALGVVDKSRTLMFGDSVNSDIRGGINAGIDTCLFDPSGIKQSEARYVVRSYDELLKILWSADYC